MAAPWHAPGVTVHLGLAAASQEGGSRGVSARSNSVPNLDKGPGKYPSLDGNDFIATEGMAMAQEGKEPR